jgi:hypothetical protein
MCHPLSERADIDCPSLRIQGQMDCESDRNPGVVCVGRVPNSQNAIPVAGGSPELNHTSMCKGAERASSTKTRPTSVSSTFLLFLASEQMKSKLFFDLSDLSAERRLGKVPSVGGPREVQLFVQDHDGVQMTYFNPTEHSSKPLSADGRDRLRPYI